tara:strand:- start:1117 stop:1422 length:306 start_codon:yes stop_codon:yes gene_type:complete
MDEIKKSIFIEQSPPISITCNPVETKPKKKKSKKKKSRKLRCGVCKKRLGFIGIKCKCGQYFCGHHRYASEHNCDWNYQDENKTQLIKENPDLNPTKIDII